MLADTVLLDLLSLDREKVAYLAGFFDGEGYISFSAVPKRKRHLWFPSIYIGVSNTDPKPLHLYLQAFGGNIYGHKHPSEQKEVYRWEASGKVAELALRAMEPYLLLKRDRAKIALTYMTLPRGHPGKDLLIGELRKLNKRGVARKASTNTSGGLR